MKTNKITYKFRLRRHQPYTKRNDTRLTVFNKLITESAESAL